MASNAYASGAASGVPPNTGTGAIAHNTTTVPTMGEKIVGTAERAIGHMLPGTDLGHQMKADGALKKGQTDKAMRAESQMDHGVHQHVTTGSYIQGEVERAAGHALPGLQAGHRLKAEGAMHKGDVQKAERAAAHLKNPHV
ncbi:hypothetical protein PhCBS80983_g06140 [Powellomyces hirtus]|uniref:Uncharacterized protein n=1 Tax=Powellomyces hirtus TaxID=109895 RepID=A0A507DQ63_9FUNG|nr:hypothetical protein PhCBS80983_g06140 [Powellomyces hirtus]